MKNERLLRCVCLTDAIFVNVELAPLGYAQPSTYPRDVRYQDFFRDATGIRWRCGRVSDGETTTPTCTVGGVLLFRLLREARLC